jgi:hypothetical protein
MDLRSPKGIHHLSTVEGLDTKQIAGITGIPEPQVYNILHKHRSRLHYLRTRLAKRAAARTQRSNEGKVRKPRLIRYAGHPGR